MSPVFLWAIVMHLLWLAQPLPVLAHPMGNFSINHFSELKITPTTIRLSYVVDMAEIPTFQEIQAFQLTAQSDHPSVRTYLSKKSEEFKQGLSLTVDGNHLPFTIRASQASFPPGAGNLPTLRIHTVYEAVVETSKGNIVFENHNFPNRMGWREIIAKAGEGISLTNSSVPEVSQSQQLTTYQEDELKTPPQNRIAYLSFNRTMPSGQEEGNESRSYDTAIDAPITTPPQSLTAQSTLTDLLTSSEVTVTMGLFSLIVALGLGAFHALEPGHGKTLVAAYLIGSRGTPWHAVLLGLTVTASHTIGVFALGAITLFASQYIFPEQLYPWLGVTSGILIMITGALLLARLSKTQSHQTHAHHHHPGHTHGHSHELGSHHHPEQANPSLRSLLTLGITGGMIPCPAALVVLLSAVALNKIGFGMLLILAFSAGLALVLVTIGLLLVSTCGLINRWSGESHWVRYMPYVSPLVITPLGLFILVNSLSQTGLLSNTIL